MTKCLWLQRSLSWDMEGTLGCCWSWHRNCCTENCECWKLWVLPTTQGWAFQGTVGGRAALHTSGRARSRAVV